MFDKLIPSDFDLSVKKSVVYSSFKVPPTQKAETLINLSTCTNIKFKILIVLKWSQPSQFIQHTSAKHSWLTHFSAVLEQNVYLKISKTQSRFSRIHPKESSVSSGGTVGEDVSALPGQMIASSSVTLRARSSRSACKSWNICKLTSYQRATSGLCEGGVGGWRHQAESRGCSWLIPLPVPAGRYSGSVSAPTFDPCLKLTLPQASYSPWIPIIVSRIKTLSAKIFSASLIWCIPSPCEDRYSCQGKENKPRKLFAKMQDIVFFSGHRSAVSGG